MTRTLLFSILLASQVMGADTLSNISTSAQFLAMPDSEVKEYSIVQNYSFSNPQIEITADHHVILDSVLGIGVIHPGDCLTVDSNQALIRCPVKTTGYLHSTKITERKSKKLYGSCRDNSGSYCMVEFPANKMLTCPDHCQATSYTPK